mgnify:FL=1
MNITRTYHSYIISLTLAFSVCFSCTSNKKEIKEERSPNIIFILSDDLSWGDLVCYGQEKIKTPNIDRIAYV